MLFTRRRLLEWQHRRMPSAAARTTTCDLLERCGSAPVVAAARGLRCWLHSPRRAGRSPRPCLLLWAAAPGSWLVDEPAAARPSRITCRPQTLRFCAACRPANLALLRDLRGHRRGELAAARQLPGSTRPSASPTAPRRPTSAWRCWPTWPPYDFGYLAAGRLLERTAQTLGTMEAGALPRSLLQLVRHALARAAAPAVRLDGRQRQPRRATC